ncbi:MAG TPA: hypothetical protein VF847_03535 [Candidatus Deferrimicrobiaceae bacterium]
MEVNKIVVRYRDGRIRKGYTENFFPNKPKFHLRPLGAAGPGEAEEVMLNELKAVFFVRDFSGDRVYKERKTLMEGEKTQGRVIEVTFADGEMLVGTTMGYDPRRPGYFIFPIDPKTNNLKIFVVSASVRSSRYR